MVESQNCGKIQRFLWYTLIAVMTQTSVLAQEYKFFAKYPDSVAVGEYFEVMFVLENANGKIEAPDFYGLKVVSGPNQSFSTSIINGDAKQSMSVYYVLVAAEEGDWVIERATVEINGIYLESEPATIVATKNGPKVPKDLSRSEGFNFDDFFDRRINKKPNLKQDKPKMSRRDSILKKYKVKKY